MNDVKVKICGIRSLESAQVAIDAGADFLGFNFVKQSKRYIYPIRAKAIIDTLRIKDKELGIKVVGVFQNHSIHEVNNISEFINLDFVQLHGEEDMEYITKVKPMIIKVCRGRSCTYPTSDKVKYLLLDRQTQGRGQMVDIQCAKEIAKTYPVFFAGGLTPENVSSVVKEIKPFAVDVASGIETNGVEDTDKIRLFIQQAKLISSLRGVRHERRNLAEWGSQ